MVILVPECVSLCLHACASSMTVCASGMCVCVRVCVCFLIRLCVCFACIPLSSFVYVYSYDCFSYMCFYLCSDIPCFRVLLRGFVCACVSCILMHACMLVFVGMSLLDVNVCVFCARIVT